MVSIWLIPTILFNINQLFALSKAVVNVTFTNDSKDLFVCTLLDNFSSHERAKAGRPARTYIQQLCADTGCIPADLPEAMDDREISREWVSDIHIDGVTWWWWWSWSQRNWSSSTPFKQVNDKIGSVTYLLQY